MKDVEADYFLCAEKKKPVRYVAPYQWFWRKMQIRKGYFCRFAVLILKILAFFANANDLLKVFYEKWEYFLFLIPLKQISILIILLRHVGL